MYKPLAQNIQTECLVWYFDPSVVPGTSHKLRSFCARPYPVTKLIAPALADLKPMYYPGEDRLVSLNVLKLYLGDYVVRQSHK